MDDLQGVFNIAEQDQVNVTNYYAFYHDLDEREPSQIYRPEDETLALAQVRLKKIALEYGRAWHEDQRQ